jgi:hypothetical protein
VDGRVLRDKWWSTLVLLIAGMLVMYLRDPAFFHEPRFWAEEGTRYFAYAYSQPWHAMLGYNFRGFFSLFNKVSALLAVYLVDLPNAPLVTTLLAFVVQTIPLALILWAESSPWDTLKGKVMGVAIVLFTPVTGEIWLNTVNSQFYLALVTFLILIEDSRITSRFTGGVHMVLLLLAGLTGVVSCFLTLLYAVKAWKERTRRSAIYFSLLVACSVVQLLTLLSSEGQWAGRWLGVRPGVILSVTWVKTIVLPLFGPVAAMRFANTIRHVRGLGDLGYGALSALLLLTMGAFWTAILWKAGTYKRWLILGSYVTIVVLSIVSAIGDKAEMIDAWSAQRYFYVPSVILAVLILDRIEVGGSTYHRFVSVICAVLIVTSVTMGIVHYQRTLIKSEDWPRWRDQVARWEADHDHILQVWPEGWQVRLAPRE